MTEARKTIPVGTRIRFVKSIYGEANGDSPACVYAKKGDGGVVTGHGTPEGHWVKWDKWPHSFGAEYGTEFVTEGEGLCYIYKAELIRVVDGDTVDMIIDLGFDTSRKERFRLYGIDAPEMRTEAGKAAKAWLEDALMPLESIYVQTIQLSTKAKRDKYGRFLAVLYDDFNGIRKILPPKTLVVESINARMISEGRAKERYW